VATEQEGIKVYIPRDEAAEFKRLVEDEDKTITAVLRRLIRNYIASRKATP
jgi:hypothetical protein